MVLAIDIEQFTDLDSYTEEVEGLADWIHSARPLPGFGGVYMPGEVEEERRRGKGAGWHSDTCQDLGGAGRSRRRARGGRSSGVKEKPMAPTELETAIQEIEIYGFTLLDDVLSSDQVQVIKGGADPP